MYDRDPLAEVTEADRLTDFQQAFGKDLSRLDVQFLRFIGEIEMPTAK